MRTLSTNQAQKEVIINENFKAIEASQVFGWRVQTTTGLSFAYWGGTYQNSAGALITISDGTVTVTESTSNNYIYFDPVTNTVLNSATVPATGKIRIARVTADATKITAVADERNFALFPVGTSNSLAGGGSSFVTQADWEITNVAGRVVTIRQGRSTYSNSTEYTSTFVQNLTGTTNLTLPASSSGYIVATSGSPYVASVTSLGTQTTNMLGVLYYYTTNSTNVTLLVDCTKSGLPRLHNVFENLIAVTGNLSKANVFTAPWTTQNHTGNLSSSYRYDAFLRCLTAEQGYGVGDIIPILTGPVGAGSECYPATVRAYGTNGNTVAIVLDAAIKAQSLTTFTIVDLTPANWQMRCRIYPIR